MHPIHVWRCRFIGLVLLLGAMAPPTWAGSGTGSSIISRQNAIDSASRSMPASDQITNVHCITLIRDLSPRYSCTVQWGANPTNPPL